MRRWGTIALMLFAFIVGFTSTYNCGGGSSAQADGDADTLQGHPASDFALAEHEHSAEDITGGVLDISLIPAHSHQDYALSIHSHDEYMDAIDTCFNGEVLKWNGNMWVCAEDLDNTDADTLDGTDSTGFAPSVHTHIPSDIVGSINAASVGGYNATYIEKMAEAICYLSRATGVDLANDDFGEYCFTYVFATSARYSGDLGGPEGADQICQDHADSAGLPGTYKAWLGSLGPPEVYPAKDFVHSQYPYILVDGTLIAENWDDLTDGNLSNRINRDEYGNNPYSVSWTNVTAEGNRYVDTWSCNDWTWGITGEGGSLGSSEYTDYRWTQYATGNCGDTRVLYCFQQ